jgi:hypothetical protein
MALFLRSLLLRMERAMVRGIVLAVGCGAAEKDELRTLNSRGRVKVY